MSFNKYGGTVLTRFKEAKGKKGGHWQNEMRIISNSEDMIDAVKGTCDESGKHLGSRGVKEKITEIGEGIWERIVGSYVKERKWERVGLKVVAEISKEKQVADRWHEVVAVDDVSGVRLDPKKVMKARMEELEWMRQKGVYRKTPREVAKRRGMKIIKSRWVDINKGDDENENYRSRVVGKEFNDGSMEGIFAGTPPLEALRYLVHEAATVDEIKGKHNKVIMITMWPGRSLKPRPHELYV